MWLGNCCSSNSALDMNSSIKAIRSMLSEEELGGSWEFESFANEEKDPNLIWTSLWELGMIIFVVKEDEEASRALLSEKTIEEIGVKLLIL